MKTPPLAAALSVGLALICCASFANTAVEPAPRDAKWVARHEGFVAEAQKGGVEVLFAGDSITDFWRTTGKAVWDSDIAPLHALNLGISGDRTQHLLWRLRNGELAGLDPKVVVLLIGTNNTGWERNSSAQRNSAAEAVEGVTSVVSEIRARLPHARLIAMALLPRDDMGPERSPIQRAQNDEVTRAIEKLADGKWIQFLDLRSKFLNADGTLKSEAFQKDRLHPSALGYRIWADALQEPLKALLAQAPAPVAPVRVRIDAARPSAKVSPSLYGMMTEEINFSYEGGLYAELVRNRTFQDDPESPAHWSLVQEGGAKGSIMLERSAPALNEARPVSLRLSVQSTGTGGRVGAANEGFWGIAVRPNTTYLARIWARPEPGFGGALSVSLERADGTKVWAKGDTPALKSGWNRYDLELATGAAEVSANNRLVVSPTSTGAVRLGMVSLFPPTWNSRPYGNRQDLMKLMAGLHPSFLRLPGGNYLEGKTFATRFAWKQTLGDPVARPGHLDDAWGYRSTDGMGLLEFLEWCEDLRMKPVLAVFAGYVLDRKVAPAQAGAELEPYVREALEEIEYVTGGPETTWGRRRALDGHPEPFPLEYVEVGNEDWFDRKPGSYDGRFAQFFDAIRAKYPALKIIATAQVKSRVPDVMDDHFYRSAGQMESDAGHYDQVSRSGPKIFVGEWATREGSPTPDMNGALGDSAWMTGMERNSDLVIMSCYAPLFVNVSPHAMQWKTDLIGYDAAASYGSPAYYAQAIFSAHHGDQVLAVHASGVPTQSWQPPKPKNATALPPLRDIPTVFFSATRSSASGLLVLKVVNTEARPITIDCSLEGASVSGATAHATFISGSGPEDTNSISQPRRIAPVETEVPVSATGFSHSFPAYSVTVLEIPSR